MIQKLRLLIFSTSIDFNKECLTEAEQKCVIDMDGEFQYRYKIPNSIIPQLQSRVVTTTHGFGILISKYSPPLIYSFSDIEDISVKGKYIKISTEQVDIKIQTNTEEGTRFSELLEQTWRDISGQYTSTEIGEYDEALEEYAERLREREQTDNP